MLFTTAARCTTIVLLGSMLLLPGCEPFGSNDDDGVDSHAFVARAAFAFEVPVAGHTRLRLEAVNGTIDVEGRGDLSALAVEGERRVGSESRDDAERHLADLDVRFADRGDEVHVWTEQPDEPRGREYVVDYAVTMPEALGMLLSHVNGNVGVTDVYGRLRVDLVNGNVQIVSTEVPAGDIDVSLVNGNLTLALPTTTSARLSAELVNGTITTSNLALQDLVSTPRSLTGRLGGGALSIRLHVVNGTITVTGH